MSNASRPLAHSSASRPLTSNGARVLSPPIEYCFLSFGYPFLDPIYDASSPRCIEILICFARSFCLDARRIQPHHGHFFQMARGYCPRQSSVEFWVSYHGPTLRCDETQMQRDPAAHNALVLTRRKRKRKEEEGDREGAIITETRRGRETEEAEGRLPHIRHTSSTTQLIDEAPSPRRAPAQSPATIRRPARQVPRVRRRLHPDFGPWLWGRT